jgi:hypothetical protein
MSAQELDGSVICAEQYSGVVSPAIMVPIGIVGWIKRGVRGASPRGENPTAAGVLLGDAGATPTTQDLRTEHGFSRLHDPPGCRHPPYQGGQAGWFYVSQ